MISIISAIQAIKSDAEVSVSSDDINRITWHDGNPSNITKEQILAKQSELIAAEPIRLLREKRNALLASSDWTGLSDSALTSEVSAKWKLYRQKLRDLPGGLDTVEKVNVVTWPEKP